MRQATFNNRYTLMFPDHIAAWDAIGGWEVERFLDMERLLKPGQILYDIGAEHGAHSAIYSTFVGGESMVLVEPAEEFWPNIRLTWEANNLPSPYACYQGLLGIFPRDVPTDWWHWPACALSNEECAPRPYRYLHEPDHLSVPRTTLTTLAMKIGKPPDAITMDVEGAELLVLQGSQAILQVFRPVVWVSIHPDLAERDYGVTDSMVQDYMKKMGYSATFINTDHEEHWRFDPQ